MSDRKAVIKNADMSEEMQQDAVDCATQAMEKYNIEKDIAAFIKREFDKKYSKFIFFILNYIYMFIVIYLYIPMCDKLFLFIIKNIVYLLNVYIYFLKIYNKI